MMTFLDIGDVLLMVAAAADPPMRPPCSLQSFYRQKSAEGSRGIHEKFANLRKTVISALPSGSTKMQQSHPTASARPSRRPRVMAARQAPSAPATTLLFLTMLIAALAVLALR
jgi:hypothetical protein